jgi:phenylacetate-coenzyme A ligase PaaK-like adenylate-forming protein
MDGNSPLGDSSTVYHSHCLEALQTALNCTPMYEAWRTCDPGENASIDARYAALPILTKADIRTHFPYGLVPTGLDLDDAIARGEVSFVPTSGTADEALINIWNQDWWNRSEKASWSLNAHAARILTGQHREAILASALSVGPRSEGSPIPQERRILGRFLFLNEYGSTTEWPDGHEQRMRVELEEYAPLVLEANPSLLARIAQWAWREGKAMFQPRLITLTYEFPSAVQLRAIRRVFSCPIASSYGSTEAGYVFMECEQGCLHQNSAFCRVDLVPVRGMEASGIGRILTTTFGNRWFPLLRFEIGDIARVSPDPCPCGRTFGLTLSSIEGRLMSVFLASGSRLISHRQMDQAIASVEDVEEYRLDQLSPREVRLSLVTAGGRPRQSVLREAREVLKVLFGDDVEATVVPVPSLFPEASGKFLLARRHFPLDFEISTARRGGSNGE